jgi:GNAT superfamily N-acetyltransferase
MTDEELVEAWETLNLPFDEWTHRAHVKVAYTYLKRHPFFEALAKMRSGVKAYNTRNNVPENATRGYNETTTHAFMHLILATMNAYGPSFNTPDGDSFCDAHPQLMTHHCLRLFYSPAQRMHALAKTKFIEPDLAPLPKILPVAEPVIAAERPDTKDAMLLIAELQTHLESFYPPESRHGFSVERLITESVAFFVLRVQGETAVCGGLKLFGCEYGEIKRMYVRPQFRGRGFGQLILDRLAEFARAQGVTLLRLEPSSS